MDQVNVGSVHNRDVSFQFCYQNYYKQIKAYLKTTLPISREQRLTHSGLDDYYSTMVHLNGSREIFSMRYLHNYMLDGVEDNERQLKVVLCRRNINIKGSWLFSVRDEDFSRRHAGLEYNEYIFRPYSPKTLIDEFKIWMEVPRNLSLDDFNTEYQQRLNVYLDRHAEYSMITAFGMMIDKTSSFQHLSEDNKDMILNNLKLRPIIMNDDWKSPAGPFDKNASVWARESIDTDL
jgi:hypothetical protein